MSIYLNNGAQWLPWPKYHPYDLQPYSSLDWLKQAVTSNCELFSEGNWAVVNRIHNGVIFFTPIPSLCINGPDQLGWSRFRNLNDFPAARGPCWSSDQRSTARQMPFLKTFLYKELHVFCCFFINCSKGEGWGRVRVGAHLSLWRSCRRHLQSVGAPIFRCCGNRRKTLYGFLSCLPLPGLLPTLKFGKQFDREGGTLRAPGFSWAQRISALPTGGVWIPSNFVLPTLPGGSWGDDS